MLHVLYAFPFSKIYVWFLRPRQNIYKKLQSWTISYDWLMYLQSYTEEVELFWMTLVFTKFSLTPRWLVRCGSHVVLPETFTYCAFAKDNFCLTIYLHSHWMPLKDAKQAHTYVFPESWQVPPFWQGLLSQGFPVTTR